MVMSDADGDAGVVVWAQGHHAITIGDNITHILWLWWGRHLGSGREVVKICNDDDCGGDGDHHHRNKIYRGVVMLRFILYAKVIISTAKKWGFWEHGVFNNE